MSELVVITFLAVLVGTLGLAWERALRRAERAESNLDAAMHLVTRYERLLAAERALHDAEHIAPGATLREN